MDNQKLKEAVIKAGKALWKSFPVLLGAILLISLANVLIPKSFYLVLFSKIPFLDSLIGSLVGSILAGNPVTSYIFGGEMLKQGVSLIAVTAFLVAWVTVGLVQLPAESILLGKRFAIVRNITAFLFSIITALITVFILGVIT
jgi:uncharacterized membrane protein YraQ (UPF0718 family)